MIEEKKMIKEETVIQEFPALMIEFTIEKLCRGFSALLVELNCVRAEMRDTAIAENTVERYSIIPVLMFPSNPAPTPETTKASEGLVHKGSSLSSSSLHIN
jgi:hypothetical protein